MSVEFQSLAGILCVLVAEGRDQHREFRVEVIAVAEIYPLKSTQNLWDRFVWYGSIEDRNHPLVVGGSVINFSLAIGRSH